jgi:hypothetical protein
MIGYLMIWVVLALFLLLFLVLFTITLIRAGIGRLRQRRESLHARRPERPG